MSWYERTEALIGSEGIEKLKDSHVAVFGVGGVGSYVAEAIARAGVGEITLVDGDRVAESNINRQLVATSSTVGQPKVEIMKQRILDINPEAKVNVIFDFYTPENREKFINDYTYVVDAIDSVPNKIDLIEHFINRNIKMISSMGTANKLDPTMFEVSDIYKTSVCPLAKVMRKKLKEKGIRKLKVVYSKEEAKCCKFENTSLGSVSFVPSVAGLILAGEVIKDIIKEDILRYPL